MVKKKQAKPPLGHLTVKKTSRYGPALYGLRIYFEGRQPKWLKDDGVFKFGKNILETLKRRFGASFRLVLAKDQSRLEVRNEIHWIYISKPLLDRMNGGLIEKNRDLKNDIVEHALSKTFPQFFEKAVADAYVPGKIARILKSSHVSKMSSEDKDAIRGILPDFIASESIKSVNLLKAAAQIESLRELEADLRNHLDQVHSESWWQTYIKERILVIQQGYIRVIEKLNIAVGSTKFPDFLLMTHDGYLDILEIKKPNTNLLKADPGRGNFYWDPEISKAVIQTENYMSEVERHRDAIRSHLKDKYGLDLQVLRPRGIILAGNLQQIETQKEKDDLRLLSQSMKHITIVTYDELLTRLSNYIGALESYLPSNKS